MNNIDELGVTGRKMGSKKIVAEDLNWSNIYNSEQ
jgi:hypothetical protein